MHTSFVNAKPCQSHLFRNMSGFRIISSLQPEDLRDSRTRPHGLYQEAFKIQFARFPQHTAFQNLIAAIIDLSPECRFTHSQENLERVALFSFPISKIEPLLCLAWSLSSYNNIDHLISRFLCLLVPLCFEETSKPLRPHSSFILLESENLPVHSYTQGSVQKRKIIPNTNRDSLP